jgi:hypothetical protein
MNGNEALQEIHRVARPAADGLFGLTVNITRVEQPKLHHTRWTYIWNRTAFVDALGAHGFTAVWEMERPGPTREYRRLYVRARNGEAPTEHI